MLKNGTEKIILLGGTSKQLKAQVRKVNWIMDEDISSLFAPSYSEHKIVIGSLTLEYMASDASSTDFDETGQIMWRVSKVSLFSF